MNKGTLHLCLSHSPLTSWVFEAGMKELGIAMGDVRSLTRRSVKPVGEGRCLDDLAEDMELHYKKFQRKAYRRDRDRLDRYLVELTSGREFVAYVPHTHRILYQEVICHADCVGYQFLEEGFTSMSWADRGNSGLGVGKRIQYALRTAWSGSCYRADRPMFDCHDPRFRGALAISKHAFAGMPGVRNVAGAIPPFQPGSGQRRWFAVLDSSYLHRGIRWDDYEAALVAAILATGDDPVAIKFHFVDRDAHARFSSIEAKIAPRVVTLLEKDFSIEENLRTDDGILFAVTSLGYYAALFGGTVRCFASSIRGLDVNKWIDGHCLPADFEEIVYKS